VSEPSRTVSDFGEDALFWASRALNKGWNRPDWVSVNLTLKCNLSCTFCKTCYPVKEELSTREIQDIIDQTFRWGVKRWNPIGGEPFVRPDLEEILEYACRKDFYITLTTNGTLISPKRAARIAEIPSNRLHFNFSIDGPNPWHDEGRGAGNFDKVVRGYRNLREADRERGNAVRKVTINTIINARNLSDLPSFLFWCRDELGAQGVQFLNLFRHGNRVDPEIQSLWIPESRLPELDEFVDFLLGFVEHEANDAFSLANTKEDLANIKRYYRGELQPLDGRCYSGWKELYINADGTAIMCDGKLDFLNGSFGDIRKQTLRELWTGEEITRLRQNVKDCQTPCIQDCYLRRRSDSALRIARGVGLLLYQELKKKYVRPQQGAPKVGDAELTVQLSDVLDVETRGREAAGKRLAALWRGSPEPLGFVREDPFRFYELRNRGALDFGRGFLDMGILKALVEDAQRHDQRYRVVRLGWDGEPLLHPQMEEILRWLVEAWRRKPFADVLEIPTNGTLLNHNYARITTEARDVPWRWCVQVDAWDQDSYLLHHGEALWLRVLDNINFLAARMAEERGATSLVIECLATERTAPAVAEFTKFWTAHLTGMGLPPALSAGQPGMGPGAALLLRCEDPGDRTRVKDARAAFTAACAAVGLPVPLPPDAPRRSCGAYWKRPTVSWDGKLVLCPTDTQQTMRVGDLATTSLTSHWWEGARIAQIRKQARREDTTGMNLCRGCPMPYSPNGCAVTTEELERLP
jgi:radical SAM protein with 4Fe4S-binding SPASM domain